MVLPNWVGYFNLSFVLIWLQIVQYGIITKPVTEERKHSCKS